MKITLQTVIIAWNASHVGQSMFDTIAKDATINLSPMVFTFHIFSSVCLGELPEMYSGTPFDYVYGLQAGMLSARLGLD